MRGDETWCSTGGDPVRVAATATTDVARSQLFRRQTCRRTRTRRCVDDEQDEICQGALAAGALSKRDGGSRRKLFPGRPVLAAARGSAVSSWPRPTVSPDLRCETSHLERARHGVQRALTRAPTVSVSPSLIAR